MCFNHLNVDREKFFPLLETPREIRDQICRELLVPEKLRNPLDRVPHYHLEPSILLVNHRVHEEASAILYKENIWIAFRICESLAESAQFTRLRSTQPTKDECHFHRAGPYHFPGSIVLTVGLIFQNPEIAEDITSIKVLVSACDFRRYFHRLIESHLFRALAFEIELEFDDGPGAERLNKARVLECLREVRNAASLSAVGTIMPLIGRNLLLQ